MRAARSLAIAATEGAPSSAALAAAEGAARGAHEAVPDRQHRLADDREGRGGVEQVVRLRDGADERALDRQHAEVYRPRCGRPRAPGRRPSRSCVAPGQGQRDGLAAAAAPGLRDALVEPALAPDGVLAGTRVAGVNRPWGLGQMGTRWRRVLLSG